MVMKTKISNREWYQAYCAAMLESDVDKMIASVESARLAIQERWSKRELGRDFCFVGSEYPIQVGGRDFALDLLFFHRGLNCLVAIELKAERFEPAAPVVVSCIDCSV